MVGERPEGIVVECLEDGSGDPMYFCRGHIDFEVFWAAVAAQWDECAGERDSFKLQHGHFVEHAGPNPTRADWEDGWYESVDASTPGAFPVTEARLC